MEKVKRNFLIDAEVSALLDQAAVGKRRGGGSGASGIVEDALREYLVVGEEKFAEKLSRSDNLLVDKLVRILRSGDADAIKAVASNITVFTHVLRKLESTPERRT